MKRTYYLVMTVAQRLAHKESAVIIDEILPQSDERDHLIKKLEDIRPKRQCFFNALFDFYMALDNPNQIVFDTWFKQELDKTAQSTVPYIMV